MTWLLYRWDETAREWWLVGQYPTKADADRIAADYRDRGYKTRVKRDE